MVEACIAQVSSSEETILPTAEKLEERRMEERKKAAMRHYEGRSNQFFQKSQTGGGCRHGTVAEGHSSGMPATGEVLDQVKLLFPQWKDMSETEVVALFHKLFPCCSLSTTDVLSFLRKWALLAKNNKGFTVSTQRGRIVVFRF
ncbi:hypothetical protein AGDE_14474 [Angomonas deanei]|nr:hypothetical protein AGDE_14474 [Angomonas deanei]|eukprot:EPY20793.1 hypothetical protein AGDE_14474 [Angomonas deanei]